MRGGRKKDNIVGELKLIVNAPSRPIGAWDVAGPQRTEVVELTGTDRFRKAIAACRRGDLVSLMPEPAGAGEWHIVAVAPNGKSIGYLPDDCSAHAHVIAGGRRVIATVVSAFLAGDHAACVALNVPVLRPADRVLPAGQGLRLRHTG